MATISRIPDGHYTQTIYHYIKDQKYADVVQILSDELQKHPKSRAALSLLAYCTFQLQDFQSSSEYYEQLVQVCPDNNDYKIYYAQALYHAGAYAEAWKASVLIDDPAYHHKVTKLQAAIRYAEEDLSNAKRLVEECPVTDQDSEINMGCVLFMEKRYGEALGKFMGAMQVLGFQPQLAYNIALCHYKMRDYAPALKFIADVVERGIREHPELSVGITTEGVDIHSVGNTKILHETALVEAFNLKAAIEYQLKNFVAAQEALTDMPPRSEEEVDVITLHNQALMNMEDNPTEGFEKLQFLLQQGSFPPEAFANLLILYCKYEYYDLAADVLADYSSLTYKYLDDYLYQFLDAKITQQTSPEEAFRKFDEMASRYADKLRRLTKQVQEAKHSHDDELVKRRVEDYDDTLECYVPVLMAEAKIYWQKDNYGQVEKIFRKSVEFCNESDVWRLNVAHVLFMQETKYKEAIGFYEPIVKKHFKDILSLSAIILANLCVSYIMSSQTEEAEELMKKIEKEEEKLSYEDPDRKLFHLCIVNLVIGTLYCAKGNYEFGVGRIMKSLEPYQRKLGTDTWYYAKRCLLSLLDFMAKHMLMLKDSVVQDILQFLDSCELYGRTIPSVIDDGPIPQLPPESAGRNTVAFEARLLKCLFIRVT